MKNAFRQRVNPLILMAGFWLILLSGGIFVACAVQQGGQPASIEVTVSAWEAFNKGNHEAAIATAERCINEFRGAANKQQAELERANAPLPLTGEVSGEDMRDILSHQLLNDVATCFYIKGWAAENLGRIEEAKQAYRAASKYTYARAWDPRGSFWSPAEAAQGRLAALR